ncbi:unnamed protein product [Acanthosepion pharaonis]|uniref:Reverse transcriptase domain-containing protein n=1 Tax=Acanthosepion pharaonis TaxID=158019 RepID=A0A812EMY6_ACAPH|nr:unnamed protein product [Sepia pharaonis]
MYAGIKTATGLTPIKTAPLKSKAGEVITDRGKQLEPWVEHYLELHGGVGCPALCGGTRKSHRLSLLRGRGDGRDGIPSKKGHVPRDMRDANIATTYKNKGDLSDCNNYRGISLFTVVGKSLASRVYSTVCYNGGASNAFPVSSGVKQGCFVVPTLFWIFFSMLLREPHGMEKYDLKTGSDLGALSDEQQEKLNAFKIQTRHQNEKYLRAHPEVECMLADFLRYEKIYLSFVIEK